MVFIMHNTEHFAHNGMSTAKVKYFQHYLSTDGYDFILERHVIYDLGPLSHSKILQINLENCLEEFWH